ncbi:MAG: MarR family winged helix-turn-helix transcriptional regulator [Fimbriimonadaceae bacterium]
MALRALYKHDPADPLTDYSVSQLRLLRSLHGGSSTASALGEELGLSVSAITQMANRLEAAGLVARADDGADRRIKHLSLTERGIQLLAARRSRRIDQAQIVLARLSPVERRTLIEALDQVVLAGGSHKGKQPHFVIAELELRLPPAS